ncbi:versatile peroxidase VPL1 [Podospora fimiseda]|uniref:Peroxidase n=1 Tax=Podospora fimiseda TaxID=252190 RepID=A0AAN6YNP5_9PEZI|nr:versatile peroxidase VPL1 [Podospora fimiseda]
MSLKPLFITLLTTLTLLIPPSTPYTHGPRPFSSLQNLDNLLKRQSSPELLADLKTLSDSQLTTVGKIIKDILLLDRTTNSPQDFAGVRYSAPGALGSTACSQSTCCVWKYVADEIYSTFRNTETGTCNNLARQAVRLAFHDSGTWSKTLGGSGADGSIILAGEWTRGENRGMDDIVARIQTWYDKYKPYGARMGDLIQVAATVGTVTCPLGPRIRLFVGRNSSSTAGAAGRLPDVNDSAESILGLMADKTFRMSDVIALIGAHTVSRQRFVDPDRIGDSQDSTPGVWDVRFFKETVQESAPEGVLRFASDKNLAAVSGGKAFFDSFADSAGNQFNWATAYSAAFIRLSLLGVKNLNNLKECTSVLPLRDLTA